MKKLMIALLAFLILSFSSVPVLATDILSSGDIPDEVMQTAEKGMLMYKTVVKRDLDKWGLATNEEADQVIYFEAFETVFLRGDITSVHSDASILDLKREPKYPEWLFVIELNGEPKAFLSINKRDGSYNVASFQEADEYFGHARDAFQEFAGDSVEPILLSFGMQDFLMTTKDGQEYIIPVPYNQESDAKVVSGNGVITSDQLIAAIQKNYQDFLEKNPDPENMAMGGSLYINVWDVNPDEMKVDNGTTSLIIISTISVIAAAILTIMLISLRNKKVMQQ